MPRHQPRPTARHIVVLLTLFASLAVGCPGPSDSDRESTGDRSSAFEGHPSDSSHASSHELIETVDPPDLDLPSEALSLDEALPLPEELDLRLPGELQPGQLLPEEEPTPSEGLAPSEELPPDDASLVEGPSTTAPEGTTDQPAIPSAPLLPVIPPVAPPVTEQATPAEPTTDPDLHLTRGDARWHPLFVDWPEPQLAIYLTGRQHGYIEPCGCTGLETQKGGLNRRFSFLTELRQRGWEVLPLDVGNQVRRVGRQAEIKFQSTIDALSQMGYIGIGYGPDDLVLSAGELIAAAANTQGGDTTFLCANVDLLGLTTTHRVLEVAGRRIGITAILGESHRRNLHIDEITSRPAVEALRDVVAQLTQQQCDFTILLAHADLEESQEIARQVDAFDVVVTAGGSGEPTHLAEPIEGSRAKLVQVGVKGMYVGILGLYDDAQTPMRYQRVDLDARFPDARPMLDLMASYQQQLEVMGLEGLQVRPVPHPSGRQFVGSQVCSDCHTQAFEVFEGTPHAEATLSLSQPAQRSEVYRHFDPECLSCHVTGWDPQGYFPYESGYLSIEQTPLLQHNGCENCHGPGSEHVAVEMGEVSASAEEVAALRDAMRLTLGQAEEHCMTCHDLDNSPDFHHDEAFQEYWEQVEHTGKD